ncbi:MAG: 4Fe-4S dicluster domain-containing protein, partial [Coleofasciculaceae cyanobacterium RL_1_1]|nr:4Fe-4S dicluster domain-containing protein [Coleofasciculaceae cyanobacterium RL_1_1]
LSHELFGLDHNRCILCTRCVRVCDEIEGAHVWDIANRGGQAKLISGLNQPWGEVDACTNCGKCVDACPTGAIFKQGMTASEMKHDRDKIQFLKTAREENNGHDKTKTSDRLARRLFRLPYVVPRSR